MTIRIDKGLDIPIMGAPEQTIHDARPMDTVALLGLDYPDLRPALKVAEGDRVKAGQTLFVDRRHPDIAFTAPGGGTVSEINRAEKRRLQSVVITLDAEEQWRQFPSYPANDLSGLERRQVVETLLQTGLWTALRTRPFEKTPRPDAVPRSLFVTAMDSNPLSADPQVVIGENPQAFIDGLAVVSRLTEGPVFVCKDVNARLPKAEADNIRIANFWGVHPVGLPGTHIHFLDPVGPLYSVWHVSYRDVMAIGETFTTGRLSTARTIALGGPGVGKPRLLKSRLGTDIEGLIENELKPPSSPLGHRILSGSPLNGRAVSRRERHLGLFHGQISVLPEEQGDNRLRKKDVFSAHGIAKKPPPHGFPLTTARHGEPSAIVPFHGYDKVMPLDILATPLLRALAVGDTDKAQALGCLELAEEDLALLSFVCPGKLDYGPLLRDALGKIEKEG